MLWWDSSLLSGDRTHSSLIAIPTNIARTRQKARDWESFPEAPNYSVHLTWMDLDEEEHSTTTNLVAVSKEMESLVKEACTKRLLNSTCIQIRNFVPQMAVTRTPQLVSFIKLEILQPVKTIDTELAKIQTLALDVLASLTSLLESNAKGRPLPTIRHWIPQKQLFNYYAIPVLGSVMHKGLRCWHIRRNPCCCCRVPSLFGLDFACKTKELVDQVKAIRSNIQKVIKCPFWTPYY